MKINLKAPIVGRHITAVYTFIILLPLVYYIPPWINHYITNSHFFTTVLAVAVIVVIVSYIALPFLFTMVKILTRGT